MSHANHDHICLSTYGAITPLGDRLDEITEALVSGRSGIRAIEKYDTSSFSTRFAGIPEAGNREIHWPRNSSKTAARPGEIFYAERAIDSLLDEIDPLSLYAPERLGCILGIDEPTIDIQRLINFFYENEPDLLLDRARFIEGAIEYFRISELMDLDAVSVLRTIARKLLFRGYSRTHAGLCSASLQSMGMARAAILSGRIDAAIVGGVSAKVTPINIARLEGVSAVCTDAQLEGSTRSRPFDIRRSGFVPAEGAVLYLMERESEICARGSKPLARICGYGSSLSAEHIIAPHSQQLEMTLCMTRALHDAGIVPSVISAVNAHGTSTKLNDLNESHALNKLFDGAAPPVVATKSLHGHLIAATGAMEVLATIASFRHDFLPATDNLDELDPAVHVPVVRKTRYGRVSRVLKNSFGMGGLAASMVLENPATVA